ncbi:sensor domain-containing diguanylate cyclase [Aureimonas pseudogalii]|uniref:Diguanylate cyclase (GGDEF)-like protein n=1 Tax=Aureimonas pseudogalii TaxID=1744844 RepID=A0A7W6MLS0_9HYPH|nr:GGDEF domain-containing protein [Aureimonas pseudogalii]MBB4000049.1 diguanylate cyclase (GGDEF)-like protein [Aureimonas pseudogalii]
MQRDLAGPATGPFGGTADAYGFDMFALAPVPLWLEDWSAIRALMDEWRRAGVEDLEAFLAADPSQVRRSAGAIRILDVNPRTLALFEAADTGELVARLGDVFAGVMLENHRDELVQLWSGSTGFTSQAVNHTLTGRALDIQLKGRILPGFEADWSRVLVVTEDVSEREAARRRAAVSEAHARFLFEHSPVSIWVEDFSQIHALLAEVRASGVTDFRTFLEVHPEFLTRCMSEVRVIDVNRQTLTVFGAPDLATLLASLPEIFRDRLAPPFREELIDLWNGRLTQTREVVNYSLDGEEMHFVMQFHVLPGHEHDWSLVQVALTDITARKKAEAYLEYLGKHDVLTKLYNRSFYADEMNRLERRKLETVSVLVADLNGLKGLNDQLGHAAGDTLLRRAGEVFAEAVRLPWHAARIGGDEFAVLMPHAGAAEAAALLQTIDDLCVINSQFHPGERLSLSMGTATLRAGERLEETVKRADLRMYEAKRRHYATTGDRRGALPAS